MTTYWGVAEDPDMPLDATNQTVVRVENGEIKPLNWQLDVRNHSPDGLGWGYNGSAPTQAALAILCDLVGVQRALPLYEAFRRQFLAWFPAHDGWVLMDVDIIAWVKRTESRLETCDAGWPLMPAGKVCDHCGATSVAECKGRTNH